MEHHCSGVVDESLRFCQRFASLFTNLLHGLRLEVFVGIEHLGRLCGCLNFLLHLCHLGVKPLLLILQSRLLLSLAPQSTTNECMPACAAEAPDEEDISDASTCFESCQRCLFACFLPWPQTRAPLDLFAGCYIDFGMSHKFFKGRFCLEGFAPQTLTGIRFI